MVHMDSSDVASLSPVEIDTILADVYEKVNRYRHSARIGRASRNPRPATIAQAERYEALVAELTEQAAPYEAEYRTRRWNRYFLVTNHGGHVHRNMDCSTCRPTTRYAWLVELAGCDEAAMIDEFGEAACTVCFPDAPTHPAFGTPGRRGAGAVAERERVAAERAATKAAKNLTSDQVFTDLDDWKVRTVAATKTALRSCAEAVTVAAAQPDNAYWANRARVAARVADTAREVLRARGVDDAELDTIWARAVTKARKEWQLT